MYLSTVETAAAKNGLVVKYADDGTPNLFYPIAKCKSSDLDPSLPNHTHPAFIVNGTEIDRRLIAVYKGSCLEDGGVLHSLPNMPPVVNTTADTLLNRIKAAGSHFGPKTCADSGLLLLLARKNGWTVKGNTNYGIDSSDATGWVTNANLTVGAKRAFRGYLYTCLIAHLTSVALRPDESPMYWERGAWIGGNMFPDNLDANNGRGNLTLTGSGPASWCLDGTPGSIADLIGNCGEQDWGYRIYNGELQILPNNDAADPDADLSASSAAWKAILPHAGDDGYDLVSPGTAGTLKWNYLNNKITLDTVAATITSGTNTHGTAFASLDVNTANIPYVPSIMYELGLFPIPGDTTKGMVYHEFGIGGERFPRRGGNYASTSNAGLGFEITYNLRNFEYINLGARSAYLE